RSAVSRYYYAAYHHALSVCRTKYGYKEKKSGDDHTGVRAHVVWIDEDVADSLDDLRKWRNMCDYADVVANLSVIVAEAKAGCDVVFKFS
ncbi:MAG TPA: hypothetical protein VGD81_07345, partial [Opitutaceae bacterium]